MTVWTIDDALLLIRTHQDECMKSGYYLALAGGVLNKGSSSNDLDLVAVPRSCVSHLNDILRYFTSVFGAPVCQPRIVHAARVYTYRVDNGWLGIVVINA